jgi:hypothetical protein
VVDVELVVVAVGSVVVVEGIDVVVVGVGGGGVFGVAGLNFTGK